MEKIYKESIILIGPSGAGKSTIAEVLSKKTGLPRLSLDYIANTMRRQPGFIKFENSDKFYEYLITDTLSKIAEPGICDFGAGHSVYKDPEIFKRIKEKLESFENIVLLLPNNNIHSSLEILNNRSNSKDGRRENLEFLMSPCNEELAKIVVYTENKNPDEIGNEILQLIGKKLKTRN